MQWQWSLSDLWAVVDRVIERNDAQRKAMREIERKRALADKGRNR